MFDLKTTATDRAVFYDDLAMAAEALTATEPDWIANMANLTALLFDWLPDLNWAGCYRVVGDELLLGPFQGKPACIRIAFGQGVCGVAAATAISQRVDDVHAFPGHIACDAASMAELVVPVLSGGRVAAVIDLDSPVRARFDEIDRHGIEALAARIGSRICP